MFFSIHDILIYESGHQEHIIVNNYKKLLFSCDTLEIHGLYWQDLCVCVEASGVNTVTVHCVCVICTDCRQTRCRRTGETPTVHVCVWFSFPLCFLCMIQQTHRPPSSFVSQYFVHFIVQKLIVLYSQALLSVAEYNSGFELLCTHTTGPTQPQLEW